MGGEVTINTGILTIIRGDTISLSIQVLDLNGNQLDITGSEAFFTFKKSLESSDPGTYQLKWFPQNIAQSSQQGQIGYQPQLLTSLGQTLLQIPQSDSKNFIPGLYYYDLQFVSQSGFVGSTIAEELNILYDVTIATS